MAYTWTVDGNQPLGGGIRMIHGTFTSSSGDNEGTLAATTHGINYITDYNISLDTGGLGTQRPKATVSSGTITFTFMDTEGYSGKWQVTGR
jgi:hypothetical protein